MGVITGVILSLYSSGRVYHSAHISSLSLWCSCCSTVVYCMALGCFIVFFWCWVWYNPTGYEHIRSKIASSFFGVCGAIISGVLINTLHFFYTCIASNCSPFQCSCVVCVYGESPVLPRKSGIGLARYTTAGWLRSQQFSNATSIRLSLSGGFVVCLVCYELPW